MERSWVKLKEFKHICVVQEDALLLAHDNVINFVNIAEKMESLYFADGEDDNGDGINCIAGHPTVPIFAFAELRPNSKIIIKTYPHLKFVASFGTANVCNYIALAFSSTDFLLALTGMHDFQLEVWNWRTSTLMTSQNTGIRSLKQNLSCNWSKLMTTIQWSIDSERIKVWNVHLCAEMGKLVDSEIKLPKDSVPKSCSFLNETEILVNDQFGNVFKVNLIDSVLNKITISQEEQISITLAFDNQYFIATNSKLIYYPKPETGSMDVLSTDIDSPLDHLITTFNKYIIGISKKGEIFQIKVDETLEIEVILSKERDFKYVSVINETHFLLIDDVYILFCELDSGKQTNCISHQVIEITSFSFIKEKLTLFLGSKFGKIKIFKYRITNELEEIKNLYICNNEIVEIKNIYPFVVAQDSSGIFFIIDSSTLNVLSYFKTYGIIFDFVPSKINDETLRILICFKMAESNFGFREIETILFHKETNKIERKIIELDFSIASIYLYKNSNQYVINPYLNYKLQIISIDSGPPYCISILNDIKTKAKFKFLKSKVNSNKIIAFGYDGQVSIIDESFETELVFKAIHRSSKGIVDLHFNQKLSAILVLDRSGNLFCLKTGLNLRSDDLCFVGKRPLEQPQESLEIYQNLKPLKDPHTCWLISLQKETVEKDKYQSENDREFIFSQINVLKTKIGDLLDKNEGLPEDEKLAIQDFNLNEKDNEQVQDDSRSADAKRLKIEMGNFIAVQNQISDWIFQNCWDIMEDKARMIRGIFLDIKVENYSLIFSDKEKETQLEEANQNWNIDQLAVRDIFLPWRPIGTTDLERVLSQDPEIVKVHEINLNKEQSPFQSGTISERFVKTDFKRYDQLEVVSYQQMKVESTFGYFTMLSLRKFFNEKFMELENFKHQQMAVIREKNQRLRMIQNELNILVKLCDSREKFEDLITDPVFEMDETPEKIKVISDDDIKVKPYVSIPTTEDGSTSKESTSETSAQELFGDNFKERMLQVMMDNVLEIRWEDEIKKTPSVPVALKARKELKDYDEHDFRAVKEYEDKLKFLGSERQKYKNMLLDEKRQIQDGLDKRILEFNYRVGSLMNLKIEVQMAINQENIKLLGYKYYNFKRLHYSRKEQEIRLEISKIKKEVSSLTHVAHEMEKRMTDCKTTLESLDIKDKAMDKQFKNNFAEASSHAIVDQAYKFFKRRPRWTTKPWATAAILADVAKRTIVKNSSSDGPPLHQDCFDFLHLLDQIDQFSNCPSIMDARLWDLLCRTRRAKIESEFKVRSMNLQVTEAEETVESLAKEIFNRKVFLSAFDKKLEHLKGLRQKNLVNRSIQLVMKKGIVELDLTGSLDDFREAILINRSDVEDINKVIKKAGAKKLTAMNNAAIFRRKVLHKKWEHQVLKMRIRDMKNYIKIIEKCKITKEVQLWIKRKQKKWVEDVSQMALNREIEGMIAACEKEYSDMEVQIKTIDKRIQLQQEKNLKLDKQIQELNLDVSEQQKLHDSELYAKNDTEQQSRLSKIVERTKVLRKVQKQHAQIVELTTLLELQRLRTYPTLSSSKF